MGNYKATISTKIAIIAITASLYAVAKGLTSYIPTPWGVGQLLIGIFVPAYLAVVSEPLPVAIGAGLGTFIGDSLFLTPAGLTNPALSLIAGVPANFIAFYLFSWFVKRYNSWPSFVAATVSFVTLGNLIAASLVILFGASVFAPVQYIITHFELSSLILGFTLFWTSTMVPAILIVVPLLIRLTRPIQARSNIIRNIPAWSVSEGRRHVQVSVLSGLFLLLLGVLFIFSSPSTLSLFPGFTVYLTITVLSILILGPIIGSVASRRVVKISEG